jgi:two-component system, cell cycle sensor histidine kinase and response regulator CckA
MNRSVRESDDQLNNRLFGLIVEHAPACIALLRGPDFIFEVVNPAYAAIAPGIPMLGRRVAEVFPDAAAFVVPRLRQVLETGEPCQAEDQGLSISRHTESVPEIAYFSFSYTRVTDGRTPDTNSILVLALETTNRKQAEQARESAIAELKRQWRTFDTALSNTPDFTYTFDLEGRFTYVNRALLSLWQIPLEDALGKNFFDLNYPDDVAAKLQRQIRQCIDTNRPVRDQTPFTGPTGETRHYEYIFVPVRTAAGHLEAVAGSTRDITERLRAEQQEQERQEHLRETARLESLGVMAGGIAHDFNNLLTGILGNASLLEETAREPDRAVAGEIVLAAQRAADLTTQMLAYSGRGHFVVEPIDLNAFIRENLTLLRASIQHSVSVELDIDSNHCFIDADRAQIQQVIMNILINASESFGDDAGKVSIRTGFADLPKPRFSKRLHAVVLRGRYVVLEVRDNGKGMAPETQRKIFDPFFTTKFAGRGLGLAAVLGIVKGHKGDIEVESQLGHGTVFRIFLPIAVAPAPTAEIPDIVAIETTGRTILVVDDEEVVLRAAAAALESQGFRVLLARDGSEALDVLRREPATSLVILDLTMPVMTGEQAIPLIRATNPQLPIILSSGFSEVEINRRFASSGIAGVLQKPYTVAAIMGKVGHALRE